MLFLCRDFSIFISIAIHIMLKLKRTTNRDKDFKSLILELDTDLKNRYDHDQYQYDAFNKTNDINTVVVAYMDDIAVACSCFTPSTDETIEIKKMFVNPYLRGLGIASAILNELTDWAKELNYQTAVLETGKKQPESINLYKKHGFAIIDKFGSYIKLENSVCMSKKL